MSWYWTKTTNGWVCVEADTKEDAKRIAEELEAPVEDDTLILPLPYPSTPFINRTADSCPPFCYSPGQCAGRSYCAKAYACSE